MTTLRTAAQQALEALEKYRHMMFVEAGCRFGEGDDAITALRAALAEQPEPVAWRTFDGEGGYSFIPYEDNEGYAAQWAQRNPRRVSWVEPLYTTPPQRKPLYTTPPQRKPLSLTDLQEALVLTNLIDRDAIDNPEEYDEGSTLAQIDELHRSITELSNPR